MPELIPPPQQAEENTQLPLPGSPAHIFVGTNAIPAPPATPPPLPSALRRGYAEAMSKGETLGPQDFHDAYHAAGHPPIPDLHTQLPNNADVTDSAIELAKHQSLAPTPEVLATTRENLYTHWAETGQDPVAALGNAKNDPVLGNHLTSSPPTTAPLREMIHALEGSSDTAVSPKGAIGRNQIMPATATVTFPKNFSWTLLFTIS